jgi:hypothetical protein
LPTKGSAEASAFIIRVTHIELLMKKYLYTESDIEVIRQLKFQTPKKIWWNVIQYVFEFEDNNLIIESKCSNELPVTSNSHARVMISEIKKSNDIFTPNEMSILLCENEKITDIFIARTLLYFSDYEKPKKSFKKIIISLLNSIRGSNDKKIDSYLNQIDGIYHDFVIHPNSDLVLNINEESKNLVDVGLLIVLNNKFIKSYLEQNDDDYIRFDDNYLLDDFNFSDTSLQYDYIKVE